MAEGATKVALHRRGDGLEELLLPGDHPRKTDDFALIGGHLDSWHWEPPTTPPGTLSVLSPARFLKNEEKLLRGEDLLVAGHYRTLRWFDLVLRCEPRIYGSLRDLINIDSPAFGRL